MKYLTFIKDKIVLILGGALVLAWAWIQYLGKKALRLENKRQKAVHTYKDRANEALVKGVQNEGKKSSDRSHDFNK